MELIQTGERTWYIKNPTNIGIYEEKEGQVYLIDAGNDKDAGKKILKLTESMGWRVSGILSTHSHADHIGGNKLIQDRTGCPVYAYGTERCFVRHPVLEPSFLYGGYPFRELRNKFLMAKESRVEPLEGNVPDGMEFMELPGHSYDMVGFRTDDGVWFLGDALVSEETIEKYHLFFLYDVRACLETLDKLETLEASWYIPSHCEAAEEILPLIECNRRKIHEIADVITDLCAAGQTMEEILKRVFDRYDLQINRNQYVLVGSTVRSYLSYLYEEGRLAYEFDGNRMLWKQS